jgi:hypothetical protein
LVVVERGERGGVEVARDDRLGELPDVCALLPSEPGASQVRLGQGCDPLGRHGTRESLQPCVRGAARGQRYLLLEDDLYKSLEPRRPIPERRRAVSRHDRRKMRVSAGELGDALGKRVSR